MTRRIADCETMSVNPAGSRRSSFSVWLCHLHNPPAHCQLADMTDIITIGSLVHTFCLVPCSCTFLAKVRWRRTRLRRRGQRGQCRTSWLACSRLCVAREQVWFRVSLPDGAMARVTVAGNETSTKSMQALEMERCLLAKDTFLA